MRSGSLKCHCPHLIIQPFNAALSFLRDGIDLDCAIGLLSGKPQLRLAACPSQVWQLRAPLVSGQKRKCPTGAARRLWRMSLKPCWLAIGVLNRPSA